jgi:hypothetical protein
MSTRTALARTKQSSLAWPKAPLIVAKASKPPSIVARKETRTTVSGSPAAVADLLALAMASLHRWSLSTIAQALDPVLFGTVATAKHHTIAF